MGVGQLVPKIIGVISIPIITIYLSTSEYGIYDLIISCADLIIPIITLQIQQAIFRFLIIHFSSEDRKRYISSLLAFFMISSLVGSILIFVILSACLKTQYILVALIVLLYFSESFYLITGQITRGLNMNTKYSCASIIYSVINLFLLFVPYASFYILFWFFFT